MRPLTVPRQTFGRFTYRPFEAPWYARDMATLLILLALGWLTLTPVTAPGAELQTFELPSALVDPSTPGGTLEANRAVPKVHVLLPDGYRATSKRGYPVLWLLHGANGGTDTWIPGITTLLAGLPAIVVMPDGGQFGMYMDWWNDGVRGAPAWTTYHLQVLRAEIARRYRIRRGRRWHAIAGISMGGQGAIRYAGLLPGYFGSVVGFSAAFPDMQSAIPVAGLEILPVPGLGGASVYGSIFGSAAGAFAEGNSPQAMAGNYAHTRLYLTSGDGVNCHEDRSRRTSSSTRSPRPPSTCCRGRSPARSVPRVRTSPP